jgi:hypothetical protein
VTSRPCIPRGAARAVRPVLPDAWAITRSRPETHASLPPNDTAREVGGALGIAVLGSVLASHVGHLGSRTDPAELVDGFQAALHVGAAALVIGALIVLARAPGRVRQPAAATA